LLWDCARTDQLPRNNMKAKLVSIDASQQRLIHLMVTYRIRKDRAEAARKLIAQLVAAIARHEPRTLDYRVFQHANTESSFTHTMAFPDTEAHLAHIAAPHMKQFVEALVRDCEDGPHYTEMRLIDVVQNNP
jgi:quinol monooxygenase YgiN